MATITEDYVSFEMAKLLKEKGFDECTRAVYYVSDKSIHYSTNPSNYNNGLYVAIMGAPTLQMAMKWLRRIYNVNIDIVSVWNQNDLNIKFLLLLLKMLNIAM